MSGRIDDGSSKVPLKSTAAALIPSLEEQVGRNMLLMRPPNIMNKTANDIQITAEQLLKNAEIHQQKEVRPPQQRIMDDDELREYKYRKRKEFEDRIRRQRYAQFEEQLQDFRRARSVYERALEVDFQNIGLWVKYAEMEMRHKFISHARNIWERAIYYMPRVDQFWYKYSYMEEVLGDYLAAREIFSRWMTWRPEEKAWLAYLKFEERMGEPEKQRQVLIRYMEAYPRLRTYLKVARFEIQHHNKETAREIFERTLEELGQEALQEQYFIEFAKFEIRNKELERAREIFRFGLKNIPKDKQKYFINQFLIPNRAFKLYQDYLSFEKQFGQKEEIDSIILNKRRIYYKELISQNQYNYDAWFDLVNLEMTTNDYTRIRETYEAAIKQVPPGQEKRFWRRYIYLWYNYAIFEEIDALDLSKAEAIYQRAIALVPHHIFTFSKLWIFYAQYLLRLQDVNQMRKVLGVAIGKCPNIKIFQEYIQLELQLANIDRVRQLYEKFIERFADNPVPWIKFGEFEKDLEEYERFENIFELAIENNQMNMPETVWRAYIDNQIQLKNYEKVRELYEKLLERSKHIKIWVAYTQFESSIQEYDLFRKIMERAEKYYLDNPELKEERAMLIETWRNMEEQYGTEEQKENVFKKLPKKIKKRRKIKIQEGEDEDLGFEEYYDYIFPEEGVHQKNLKLLQKVAHLWKQQQATDQQQQQQQQ